MKENNTKIVRTSVPQKCSSLAIRQTLRMLLYIQTGLVELLRIHALTMIYVSEITFCQNALALPSLLNRKLVNCNWLIHCVQSSEKIRRQLHATIFKTVFEMQ